MPARADNTHWQNTARGGGANLWRGRLRDYLYRGMRMRMLTSFLSYSCSSFFYILLALVLFIILFYSSLFDTYKFCFYLLLFFWLSLIVVRF